MSWKRELLATTRDRGLYSIITGTDLIPRETSPSAVTTDDVIYIGSIPLTRLIDEWNDKNNSAYNQILLCISPELQTAIDDTDRAKTAWDIIIKKYESTDPSKISIVCTRYKNYHMIEGQLVIVYHNHERIQKSAEEDGRHHCRLHPRSNHTQKRTQILETRRTNHQNDHKNTR